MELKGCDSVAPILRLPTVSLHCAGAPTSLAGSLLLEAEVDEGILSR
jgi:hypothetical protein